MKNADQPEQPRQLSEYERVYYTSPERKAKEDEMYAKFYRDKADTEYSAIKGKGLSVIVAVILLALIAYFSI